MTWLQEYETLFLKLEQAAWQDREVLLAFSHKFGYYYDDNLGRALKDLAKFRERTIKAPPE